jgi:hypothetical protein
MPKANVKTKPEPVEEDEESTSLVSKLPEPSTICDRPTERACIELLTEAQTIRTRLDIDTSRLAELKQLMLDITTAWSLPGVRYKQIAFCNYGTRPGRKSLNKMKLIENGCDPEIIKLSFVEGEPYIDARFMKTK